MSNNIGSTLGRLLFILLVFLVFLLAGLLYLKPSGVELGSYRFTPFATEAEAEGDASWSPDGRAIAYIKAVQGRRQVFVRSLDRDMPGQLTRGPSDASAPFWSPDSSRVWFLSAGSVWSINRAGGEAELIQRGVRAADLSPDGKTLAVWKMTADGNTRSFSVWLAAPPKGEPRKYQPSPFEVDAAFSPSLLRFSPDGASLLLAVSGEDSSALWLLPIPDTGASRTARRLFAESGPWRYAPLSSWMPDSRHLILSFQDTLSSRSRLWMADTRSERLKPLTADVTDESYPDVSPDGSKIVFTSGGADYDLVRVPLDGSPVQELLATSRSEHSAAWVPGTDQYVYVSDRNGQEELRLHRQSDHQDRPLASQQDFPREITQFLRDPAVSPDGRQVAYDRKAVEGRRFIWIAPLEGGAPVRLTRGAGGEAVPTWSPEGQWVAFLMTEGGVLQLAKAHAGGNQPAQMLVADASLSSAPEWSPTGEWIACQNREGILLVSPDGKLRRLLPRVRGTALLWSPDGSTIYTIAPRGEGGSQLLSIDIGAGVVKAVAFYGNELLFGSGMNPGLRFSLAPDGRSFTASVRRLRTDLWILEGFQTP